MECPAANITPQKMDRKLARTRKAIWIKEKGRFVACDFLEGLFLIAEIHGTLYLRIFVYFCVARSGLLCIFLVHGFIVIYV